MCRPTSATWRPRWIPALTGTRMTGRRRRSVWKLELWVVVVRDRSNFVCVIFDISLTTTANEQEGQWGFPCVCVCVCVREREREWVCVSKPWFIFSWSLFNISDNEPTFRLGKHSWTHEHIGPQFDTPGRVYKKSTKKKFAIFVQFSKYSSKREYKYIEHKTYKW